MAWMVARVTESIHTVPREGISTPFEAITSKKKRRFTEQGSSGLRREVVRVVTGDCAEVVRSMVKMVRERRRGSREKGRHRGRCPIIGSDVNR